MESQGGEKGFRRTIIVRREKRVAENCVATLLDTSGLALDS